MKIELSEDYEEKIMSGINERRKNAQKMRKKVLSIVIVFACLFGITSMGYCQFKKNEYTNYFISDSENQLIEDEYQYFDGLGIKLNFINYAEDSIVIGINFKYEDIADRYIEFEKIEILDKDKKFVGGFSNMGAENVKKIDFVIQKESKDELLYMLQITKKDIGKLEKFEVKIGKLKVVTKNNIKSVNLDWNKIIEKGKE